MSTLSLNAFAERTEYDNESLSPDYDRSEAYIRFDLSATRNVMVVDLGFTKIDVNGEKGDGAVVRIDLTRIVSPFSTITLGVVSQYSDQGDIFRFNQRSSTNLTETGDVVGLGVPFLSNVVDLGYRFDSARTSIAVRAGWSQEDFKQGSDLDRESIRYNFNLRRDLTPKLFADLGLTYYVRDNKYQARKDDDTNIRVTAGYRFGPAYNVSLSYQFLKRNSEEDGAGYDENRAFIRVTYVPAWGR